MYCLFNELLSLKLSFFSKTKKYINSLELLSLNQKEAIINSFFNFFSNSLISIVLVIFNSISSVVFSSSEIFSKKLSLCLLLNKTSGHCPKLIILAFLDSILLIIFF